MSVQVSYKRQFVFGIIFLLIILFAIEGLLRIYDYYNYQCSFMESNIYKELDYSKQKQMCNDYRDTASRGGIDIHYQPNQQSETIHINNFGMRGEDITKEKQVDTYRIIMVGGSTVFGSGSTSDEKTIPSFLQQKIEDSKIVKQVEVINAGIEGITSIEETIRIENELIDFNPDMIIIYDGFNDNVISWEKYIDNSKFKTSIQKEILYLFQTLLPEYKTPLNGVFFLESITENANLRNNTLTTPWIKSDHVYERASLWNERMKETCELGNKLGFKTIIILQPFLGTSDRVLTEYEYNQFSLIGGEKNIENYDKFATGLTNLKDYCYEVKDYRNIFDGNVEQIYFDSVHLSDSGNKIVSEKIFELIEPTLSYSLSN